MSISMNEARQRSLEFSKKWESEEREHAEAKSFWDDFFNIFGITRKRVASFEEPVKKLGNKQGFIDLFWKGVMVVEHKSRGENLDKAYSQALDYFSGLTEEELPRYVVVSDFHNFRFYDLVNSTSTEFKLTQLYNKLHLFGFMLGFTETVIQEENPADIKAAILMGKLHDMMIENGYSGHKLEVLLVRLLFCFFADDTAIWNKGHFTYYLENKTRQDGSDLGLHLSAVFEVLNTPEDKRLKNLDEDLQMFRYVNGGLFSESLPFPSFNAEMRELLLRCSYFNWSNISPAVFGSLFQSVMNKDVRQNLGAHYTSEKNILKSIKPLFLDDLYEEFEKVRGNTQQLELLLQKINNIKILDPACGCGNFLIVAYRELRLLEIKIHKQIFNLQRRIQLYSIDMGGIDVDSMYGIEVEEWPARIAEVALWLVDHQMNMKLSEEFGEYYVRLPLKKSPNIIFGNALELAWEEIIDPEKLTYIVGNPPFISKQNRTAQQNHDMSLVAGTIRGYGKLDYVTAWYLKAANYIQDTNIKVAFVSTNSITQGEQVEPLWGYMLSKGIKIHFAHRTFKWNNDAKGNASVYCVIIGFSLIKPKKCILYDYETPKSEPVEQIASNINPYLIEFKDLLIKSSRKHIQGSKIPAIAFGNMPNDDSNFLFTNDEKNHFVKIEPSAEKFMKPIYSALQFIQGEKRWCLWLTDITPRELNSMSKVKERVENVRKKREQSTRAATRELAEKPYLFGEIRQPATDYILIPRHSSENRKYIPMGVISKEHIVSDSCLAVHSEDLFYFGVLTSEMNMAWIRQICGRIKSDYRYSNTIGYNTFPFPIDADEKLKNQVRFAAQEVLDIRNKYLDQSLADLYNPLFMPIDLLRAHKKLDKAVDKCYKTRKDLNSDLKRLNLLFELYSEITGR
ncbi:class I SAM-dependent DNA methyltransferase [Priestia megaterium]|uniref:class I SAM-dependent DNA methyltransferase n=1 Tax=Priestia megaterium TaxID=1404 RepID=UPI002D7E52BC|nr:DNA methyltransferase [Priestia megaterium]MEB4859750.1 N-6 DNA methylase [Priestia megaterium]